VNKSRKTYPSTQLEYAVLLEHLDEIRRSDRSEAKKALYRLTNEAYRKGYEEGKENPR